MDVPSERLLELARRLAGEAAELILDRLEAPRSDVRTKSSATDMVSEVDHASEALIVDGIRRARPDDAVLSEEGARAAGTSGLRWVIDPLDGTTDYLYRHPGFAVSIAVELDGSAVVGVVHDVVHGEVFSARRGRGATLNGAPIAPSSTAEPGSALVATGFGYDPARRREQAGALAGVLGRIRDIRRMGAAAVDLCYVACGRVDAYYERGINHWDVAAGSLIAAEAGARLGELDPGRPDPAALLATAPALFEPLRTLLVEAGA